MADKKPPSRPSSKEKSLRATSSSSRESRRSVSGTVSKLTVKALQQFQLSGDLEDVETPTAEQEEDRFHEDLQGSMADYGDLQNASEVGQISEPPDFTTIPPPRGILQDLNELVNDEEVQDSGMDAGVESDSDDGDNDLIVLDPDHPLMQRFQSVYKDHLQRQNEKLQLELREVTETHNHRKKEREEIGVELYGIQQELARQQMVLEKEHDSFNNQKQEREQFEGRLNEVRTIYKEYLEDFAQNRRKTSDLQTEVENLANKLRLVENSKTDVRSDIAIMKRAAEKTSAELVKAEEQKKQQDLLVDRLVQRVDSLQEDISMYTMQLMAQKEETKAASKALSEATTELEAIDLEKKQLLQQWNSSLIGMRRRDEAHAAIQEAVSLQVQRIISIDTELEGYKRQIKKAQEQNEQLTYMQNRIETDIAMVKKKIGICQNKHEAIKIQYSTYSRTLHETEQQLNRATTEVTLKENEVNVVRKQIEREFLEKVRLQDDILEKMREQLTADKASQYTKKMSDRVRRRATEMERGVADVENQISKDVLESENTATKVRHLQDSLKDVNQEIQRKNDTISKVENEIVKRNAVIEKNQGTIDQYNKKIDQLLGKEGEDYAGPLEFQITTLQKQIDSKTHECLELQQFWLRQQGELVKTIKEVGVQSAETDSLRKQSTILLQKKLRLEGEIESEKNEMKDLRKSVSLMQNDMTKLNLLIHKNSGKYESLHQDNILLENDFVWTLKDSELASIQLQNDIYGLREEKERLTNALMEAERQIMLWEKKTQLAREARNAVDSEVGQGEIRGMKAEIHRMEVRFAQLMRQQEKMIQDMEKGDAQAKTGKGKLTKISFQKKCAELKKKIKQTAQETNECEREIARLREEQQILSQELEEKQTASHQLQSSLDTFDSDVNHLTETRHRNLADIVAKQQKAKNLSAVKEGKYTRVCKSAQSLENEEEKQRDRFQSLLTIVDRLNVEFPALQTALRKVTLSLGNRGIEP